MRDGSPAAETDHAWAAAAPISPLCKGAGPPVINSTGEPNDADILHRYAWTWFLSVMVFPSGHVLSWLGSRAAAGSG
jgi:hypothetical protein